MNTKKQTFLLPLLGMATLLSGSSCDSKKSSSHMNVLYIFADDLNDWNTVLGGHPQVKTPNIERLAAKSMVFTNAHTASPACGPSRASILTGYFPTKTKVFGNADNFRHTPETAGAVTLPQYFAANGYATIAAGKVFHHPRGGKAEPSELSDDISWQTHWVGEPGTKTPSPYPAQELDIPVNDYFSKSFVWSACPEPLEETGDYLLSKYIGEFVQQKHDKPFFAAAGIFRPHLSWFVPQEFIDMYPLDDIVLPVVDENDLDDIPEIGRSFVKPLVHDELVDKNKWKEAVRAYLACISYADYCIGMLLDAVESGPNADNTVIILMGDHGWHLGEKKHWSKFTLWERATRTSYMIHVPGEKAGRTDAPVSLTDLYPTLVDVCNLPERTDLHGRNLQPLIENSSAQWNHAVITWFGHKDNYALKDRRWRYIHYKDGSGELYDHQSDPNEWNNLYGDPQYNSVIDELRTKSGVEKFMEH
jgi:arylsulfatase A-like enzyme